MKQLAGRASASIAAPIQDCFDLLAAVDRYPVWYPEAVREAEVLEVDRDGLPSQARTTLKASIGPLVREFALLLAVETRPPERVTLTRIPHNDRDHEEFRVSWRLAEDGSQTRLALQLQARLSIPRLVPVSGVGDTMAQGFVAAAQGALQAL